MDTFFLILFVVLGFIIGSFLNVVIYRFNTTKSLGGRSQCLTCSTKLFWYDLVPLFSYLALLGRCRSCRTKISIQYPIIEFLTGILFGAIYLKFKLLFYINLPQFVFMFLYHVAVFSTLIVITVYDIKHKIIPDKLSGAFAILALFGLFFVKDGFVLIHTPGLHDVLSGLVVSVPFALMWLVSSGRWMGLGDAKLTVGLGLFLGVSKLLFATMIAFWSGAIVGLVLVVFNKLAGLKSEIPFAPFLVLGTVMAFFFENLTSLFF